MNSRKFFVTLLCIAISATYGCSDGGSATITPDTRDPSVARQWNEALLNAVRSDFARPTVHARNLFHTSAAMYDAWAVYDDMAGTYLLGKQVGGFACDLAAFAAPTCIW